MRLRLIWAKVFIFLVSVAAASAQSDRVLELRAPVQEIEGSGLELILPVEPAGAIGQKLSIRETASQIRVELAADIFFDFDKACSRGRPYRFERKPGL